MKDVMHLAKFGTTLCHHFWDHSGTHTILASFMDLMAKDSCLKENTAQYNFYV